MVGAHFFGRRARLRRNRPIILIATRKLACAVLALSCFTACVSDVQNEAEGTWLLTAFDGIEAERGLTTTGTPWVEIAEVFEGNTGCNDLSAAPQDGAAPVSNREGHALSPEVF